MNLRNRLYKAHFRSQNFSLRDQLQKQQKQFQKQLSQIQLSLQMMFTSFKHNSKIQEIYLDLIRATDKKMRPKEIKNIYRVLSENKTGEVMFMKEWEKEEKKQALKEVEMGMMMGSSLTGSRFREVVRMASGIGNSNKTGIKSQSRDELQTIEQKMRKTEYPQNTDPLQSHIKQCRNTLNLTYRRLYSRLIESIIKKLTFYITNKPHLNRIILHTASELSKKLQTLMRRILDMKDTKFLYEVIGLIYEENLIVEQKIYELLVDKGHVVSVQEFFRINGILLENGEVDKRRASRQSVLSGRRVSELSIQMQQLLKEVKLEQSNKVSSKTVKQSRFYQNTNKKMYQKQFESEKPDKNQLYIERLNKQIESKYASVLDKLGDFVGMNSQDMAFMKGKDALYGGRIQEISSRQYLDPNDQYRGLRSSKSILSRKRNSSFQYFSSEFKEIIKELDEKKGKVSQFGQDLNKAQGTNQSAKMSSTLPPTQFQKINKETISLQNPANVARLLQKKFNSRQPIPQKERSTLSSFMKKPAYNNENVLRHNQISKLLKIYEKHQKQSHIIDILFGTNFEDQDQKSLQKNFIKLSIMAKLKEKGVTQMKGNQLECAKFEEFMMKEIEKEFEMLVKSNRSGNKKRFKKGFASCGEKDFHGKQDNNSNEKEYENERRKVVDLEISDRESEEEEMSFQENQSQEFDLEVPPQQQASPSQNLPENPSQNPSPATSPFPQLIRTRRLTHQPHLSTAQMQLTSISNTFQLFQPNEFKAMQTPYNEFTNPLTKNCGYYNHQEYSSVRNSLEKCEINSIKLKKKIENGSLIEIERNKAFFNKIKKRGEERKYVARTLLQSSFLEQVKEQKVEDNVVNRKDEIKTQNCQNSPSISNRQEIFHHHTLKKCIQLQRDKSGKLLNTQKIIRPLQPEQLKILKLTHTRSQRNSMNELPQPIVFTSATSTPQNASSIKLRKVTREKQISLARDFCLNSIKIEKPNLELKSNDLDMFIDKYLKANKNIKKVFNKENQLEEIMKTNLSTGITSVVASPRQSFKKLKELYSTTRRVKVQ